ncbi:hypothetical protein DUI87_23586 [Hirundo rustica rustica]|uniref:CCHC-type domain-containing protein n=1 Tax=Hirundo rustica rustica TaxID=333673 RepID=A0A3M0JM62_HIRRU|nr:hypothetical protein DUI87_23586 [Hirundo rustica rustica]
MGRSDDGDGEAKMEDGLYPLRKVPMANPEQRPIGDVSVPLNTGDVREFKKEMGRLLEDPLGGAERLDQFLGLNMYTWVELQSILGILFTMEEREMIRHSGMRVWDRDCQGPDQGDQKWPMQDQNERHRQNMSDLRWMIIQGILEAVPKGQNIRKALSEHHGKDEPLADWLERLRKALQLYSGVDPDTAAGQVLLKTQCVAKSWRHIRKKLEKAENWQDRGLQEFLREAQKVEIPTAPGIIGYVNVPINTSDVRAFKKEMGKLMDDPLGVSERLDEFLGTSIYSYEDLTAILRSLFNTEEREMIRQAGIREWERRNPQSTPGDQKWPSQDPRWNAQTEEGRRSMIDMRNIIIQGIREAVPRGQNLSKVFGECQGKDETPTEWLERLRKSLQIYSGTDPDSPVGEVLLKTQFVAKSWEDIRKKLEKIEGWQEKGLQELLREAQKIYMRRDEEKQKIQAKVLVAAVREAQKQERPQASEKPLRKAPLKGATRPQKGTSGNRMEGMECFYCKKKGHMKRDCPKKIKDEKMFRED